MTTKVRIGPLPGLFVLLAFLAGCKRDHRSVLPGTEDRNTPDLLTGLGLSRPVSVVFDPDYDRYYVANQGQDSSGARHGYISIVLPTGDSLASKFIDGAATDVVLRRPEGMAPVGEFLFVADGNVVRRFDRRSGAPDGELAVPGARALGDLQVSRNGALYLSDRGDSTSAGAVYRLFPNGKLDTLASGAKVGHPTGIAESGDSVWVTTREGELFRLEGGKKVDVVNLPSGGLEGLELYGGDVFISTTEGHAVLRGKPGGPFTPLVTGLDGPGNLGHDLWRNRILVPLPRANAVRVVRLAF